MWRLHECLEAERSLLSYFTKNWRVWMSPVMRVSLINPATVEIGYWRHLYLPRYPVGLKVLKYIKGLDQDSNPGLP
jgi:hypothetical protein